jgi:hypothetical protein
MKHIVQSFCPTFFLGNSLADLLGISKEMFDKGSHFEAGKQVKHVGQRERIYPEH